MRRKQRNSLPWRRFGNVILINIKFGELLLSISPRIIDGLKSYIKHSKECFIWFPNTSKLVKKTRLHLTFSTHFLVFGNQMKHSSSCLKYYLYHLNTNQFKENIKVNALFSFCLRSTSYTDFLWVFIAALCFTFVLTGQSDFLGFSDCFYDSKMKTLPCHNFSDIQRA